MYLKAGLPGVDFGFYNLNREPIQPRREPPNYRRISPGLSFNSKCTDELCDACQNDIHSEGIWGLQFCFLVIELEMPTCGQQAEPFTQCGFYLAQWTFARITRDGSKTTDQRKMTSQVYFVFEMEDTERRELEVDVYPYTP